MPFELYKLKEEKNEKKKEKEEEEMWMPRLLIEVSDIFLLIFFSNECSFLMIVHNLVVKINYRSIDWTYNCCLFVPSTQYIWYSIDRIKLIKSINIIPFKKLLFRKWECQEFDDVLFISNFCLTNQSKNSLNAICNKNNNKINRNRN